MPEKEALRLSQEQLSTTLRSVKEGVISVDAAGRVTFVNGAAERLLGRSFDDAREQPIDQVVRMLDEASRQPVENPALVALHSDDAIVAPQPLVLLRPDGQELDIDVTAAPVRNVRGEVAGVVFVFRDVTESRKLALRQQLLAEAGIELLSASVDYDDRLATLARLVVPRFADWSAVDVVTPLGELRRLATAHVDPEKVRFVAELAKRYPADPNAPRGIHNVLRTGESLMVGEITDELLVASTTNAQHLELVRNLGLRSYICVPLIARGRTLGAITFVTAESGRRYGDSDLQFAQELARRAGLALDNANLYREAQEQRRSAEDAEARLRILAGAIPQIVWARAPSGEFEYLSDRWFDFTGQSRDTSTTPERRSAVHPDDRKRVVDVVESAESNQTAWEVDYRLRNKNGAYHWFLGRGVPMFDTQGRLVKWYGTATDIDEHKRAVRSRDELLATVSHDLRNPLGNMLMATSLLKAGFAGTDEQSARVQKQLGVLERAGRRMEALIRDLLDLAALENGHLSVSMRAESASALLAEALEGALLRAREKNVRLEGTAEISVPSVMCDRDRILQVFENLIGNSLKFCREEGKIAVGVEPTPGALHFFVKDDGPGIEAHQLQHVFDRFWQAHRRRRDGAGLGLAICKGIVELHGGEIWAESDPGAGATFWFSLPLDRDTAVHR